MDTDSLVTISKRVRRYARHMGMRILGRALALLAAICALAMAQGVAAQGAAASPRGDTRGGAPVVVGAFPAGSVCHISAAAAEDYATLARVPQRWNCQPRDWSIEGQQALLRFDFGPTGVSGAAAPSRFSTDLTRFSGMEMTVICDKGRSAHRRLQEADMVAGTNGWTMSAALPRLDGPARTPIRAVVIRIMGARHPRILAGARLETAAAAATDATGYQLVIAGLAGMLVLPLVFNFAFYRILRERFLLWHTAVVLLMLMVTLVDSGLINVIWPGSVAVLSWVAAVSFGGGIASAALFSADLLESGTISALERQALRLTAVWIPFWVAVYMLADGPARPWAFWAFYVQFVPVLALFVWIMAAARAHGSRAVYFQIIGWAPFMVLGVVRIGSALGLAPQPIEAELAQHFAIAWEVIVTAVGVTDRFMTIRRDRDRALAEARLMGQLADHDPLTGLLNRRGIEARFAVLHGEGYRAMALIDLDRFKQVNDTFGHAKGDDVLRATAQVLTSDPDTVAVRIGGEEFLLLLRGRNVGGRAERMRRAISRRVATDVPGLDRLVTASMGLVTSEGDWDMVPGFAALYHDCDKLLYQAKSCGRNRTMAEQRRVFGAERRHHAADKPDQRQA